MTRRLLIIELVLTFIVGIAIAFVFYPTPVFLTNVEGTMVSRGGDLEQLDLIVTGTKSGDCKLVSSKAEVRLKNGTWVPAASKMLRRDGTTLEISDQRIAVNSPFVRMIRVTPGGDAIKLFIAFNCGYRTYEQLLIHVDLLKTPNQIHP